MLEHIELQIDILLSHEWDQEEKELLSRVVKNVLVYGKFIPKSMKDDINSVLLLANTLKKELEELKK